MHRIINYGSFMQALSLKKVIESLGCDVEFVDYYPGVYVADRFDRKKIIKKHFDVIKREFKYTKCGEILAKLMKKEDSGFTEGFLDCYSMLGMGKRRKFHTKVDTLVIGSDEVFNCTQSNPEVGYAMELFGKNNRAGKVISYAASFGNCSLKKLEENGITGDIREQLLQFDAISVRDKNSFDVVKELTDRDSEIHLDPVLIGGVENLTWKDIDEKNHLIVYGYENRFSQEEGIAIREYAASKGLKIIGLCGPQKFCDENIYCRPDEILSYFKNAECIITDTFHGTIFSVIYHKNFLTFCRKGANSESTNHEKLGDLLNRLGLKDREVEDLSAIAHKMANAIDYKAVDEIRSEYREKAVNYLSREIKGN